MQPSKRKTAHKGNQSITYRSHTFSWSRGLESPVEEMYAAVVEVWCLTSDFPLGPGISAEDFLCVPEPDEDECLSSGLDGDETSHKQVSVEGPCTSIHRTVPRLRRVCICVREKASQKSRSKPWGQRGEGKCENVWRHNQQDLAIYQSSWRRNSQR